MENSMTPAEMANSANYAEMDYGELLNTKTAYSWAIGFQIEPRLKTRRLEEMVKITHAYVTAMNGYDATREEILSCLENVGMKETHMFSSHHDVDDQTSSVREDTRQDNGKSPLALPEPVSTMGNQDMDAEQESLDSDTPEEDEVAEDDSAASSPEGNPHLIVSENKDDVETPQESGDTIPMTPGEHVFVDEALDVLKALPTPDDIDVNAPYYVEAIFAYGDSSKPGHSDPKWRNMGMKDLEAFRLASEKYEKLFQKHDVLASTDDYLVVNESMNSIKVRMYHFPADSREGADIISGKRKKRGPKKKRDLLKEAIKQAKESSFSDETDTNVPFYDRYKFRQKDDNLELINRVRCYEDAETLSELLPAFETYASLFQKEPVTVSKDNCVANMLRSEICLVLFNIPSKKKKRGAMKKSEPTVKDDSVQEELASATQRESDLIIKGNETEALPVVNAEAKGIINQETPEQEDARKKLAKNRRMINKAIKEAKKEAMMDETDAPFLMKATYRIDDKHIMKTRSFPREYEEVAILTNKKSEFENWVKLYGAKTLSVNTDDCLAVMRDPSSLDRKVIDVVYLHIPNNKSTKIITNETEPVAKNNSVLEENPLITKAVEMTRTLPVNKTTDKNAPYFIQCDFSVTGNGDLFPGRTFSRNVESLEKYRTIHQKCATKFMATQVSFTDDYTAYMWSGNKTISVFYYIAKDKAEAVA